MSITAHIQNIALHHTVFDLPFAYIGALLGANGHPRLIDIVWITVAITAGRAAALALDNYADMGFDAQQPRLSWRPMVTGEVTRREARIFIAVCVLLLIFAVCQLAPICIYLLPLAALPCAIYPFTKRFTSYCHLVLGVAIAMAPAGGWAAVGGPIEWSGAIMPIVTLCVGVMFWMGGFDAMYGSQDRKFDLAHGLHSLATKVGAKNTFAIARIWHLLAIVAFFDVGILSHLAWPYFIGVGIAGGTLVYQHRVIRWNDFRRLTQAYFMRNGVVSIALFLCTWLAYLIA